MMSENDKLIVRVVARAEVEESVEVYSFQLQLQVGEITCFICKFNSLKFSSLILFTFQFQLDLKRCFADGR